MSSYLGSHLFVVRADVYPTTHLPRCLRVWRSTDEYNLGRRSAPWRGVGDGDDKNILCDCVIWLSSKRTAINDNR